MYNICISMYVKLVSISNMHNLGDTIKGRSAMVETLQNGGTCCERPPHDSIIFRNLGKFWIEPGFVRGFILGVV